eukprot:m.268646 g.268646  ORF g.268646 m.268646 type:complete len:190 (+) comp22812_c1_seq10:87-656(+)
MSGGCALRRCQGARGCLCPKKPTPGGVLFRSGETGQVDLFVQGGPPTQATAAKPSGRKPAVATASRTAARQPAARDRAKPRGAAAAASSALSPKQESVEQAQVPPQPQPPQPSAASAEPVLPFERPARLRYNHYVHKVLQPRVALADINEWFSFSYGFKGNYHIHVRGPGPDGPLLQETDGTVQSCGCR